MAVSIQTPDPVLSPPPEAPLVPPEAPPVPSRPAMRDALTDPGDALGDRGAAGETRRKELERGEARRRELAAFLRSWRGRLRPEDVGLTAGRRRRTPGLRREEVAELAGVGVTWYTWLEQGRDIRVSADVVEAVARTLRLDPDEREHLYALSGIDEKPHTHPPVRVAPQLQRIIDALAPYPALVSTDRYDVLAWNGTAAALLADFASLPTERRNILWLAFMDPAWKTLLIDYETHVSRMVARLRGGMGRHVGEPWWERFVAHLGGSSPLFVELWERREVAISPVCSKRLFHPAVGVLAFDVSTLRMPDQPGSQLKIWTPADAESMEAIRRLPPLAPSRAAERHSLVEDGEPLF